MPAKKKSKKSSVTALKSRFFQIINYLKSELTRAGTRTVSFLRFIPVWLKKRPDAIRHWQKNDKKKKKYRSFRLQKKIKPEPRYIPSSLQLLKDSLKFILRHKGTFTKIFIIQGLLYLAFLRSPIATNFSAIESSVQEIIGDTSSIEANLATLGAVIGTAGTTQTNTLAVSLGTIIISLVYIWAIRQLHANKKIKARDAYYQSLTPLGSSVLILSVASLQLIPFAVASFIYATARTGGLFVSGFEDMAFFIVTALTGLLSFYWMTSTIMAFYVVTLPGMYPMQALRAAKKLVQFQRLAVFRRIIALPIVLGILYLGFLLLLIRFAGSQVFFAVELIQLLIIPLLHVYIYKLYRALI